MAVITDKQAKAITPDTKAISHGGITGLYLHPSTTKGAGKWVLRFTSPITGTRRDMGLGLYPQISIAKAGDLGRDARRILEEGHDPIEERKNSREAARIESERLAWTFEKASRQVHQDLLAGWSNKKHAAQWLSTLETYIFPKIGKKPIEQITPKDCADALRPTPRVRIVVASIEPRAWGR